MTGNEENGTQCDETPLAHMDEVCPCLCRRSMSPVRGGEAPLQTLMALLMRSAMLQAPGRICASARALESIVASANCSQLTLTARLPPHQSLCSHVQCQIVPGEFSEWVAKFVTW